MLATKARIEEIGYSVTYVEPSIKTRPWAYTLNLLAGFDHPELVMMGVSARDASVLMDEAVQRIRAGETFAKATRANLSIGTVTLVDVPARHFRAGLMGTWEEYHDRFGPPGLQLRARQMVLPCQCQIRLDLVGPEAWDTEPDRSLAPNRRHRRQRQPRRPHG